jgi:hypothetical protein
MALHDAICINLLVTQRDILWPAAFLLLVVD